MKLFTSLSIKISFRKYLLNTELFIIDYELFKIDYKNTHYYKNLIILLNSMCYLKYLEIKF